MTLTTNCQIVNNTSYINQTGEKVLRLEAILPVDLETAWKLFTIDGKLEKWIAPLAHIELKSGGYIVTNYDSTKSLTDNSSIRLPIISFIDNELLILKVNLNDNFAMSVRKSDDHLQEIIQFKKVKRNHTKVISSMLGWGEGEDWNKTYNFFSRGNEMVYNDLIKSCK
jgi:hypothetical protein